MTKKKVKRPASRSAFYPTPLVRSAIEEARSLALSNPQSSLVKSRIALEYLVGELEKHNRMTPLRGNKLSDRIKFLGRKNAISKYQVSICDDIRESGNAAAHGGNASSQSANLVVDKLENLLSKISNAENTYSFNNSWVR